PLRFGLGYHQDRPLVTAVCPKEGDALVELETHILQTLEASPRGARAITIGDLAREFGVSTALIRPIAQRLVDEGRATPVMAVVYGVSSLHGLARLKTSQ